MATVENNELMQSILQVGGMFSKESQEAGLTQDDKKEGEDDDQTSSDSDGADACKRSSQAKKEGAGQRKCQNLTEEQKKKKHKRDKQRPEKLRKQLFEILLRKRIFLTDRFEKIEKSLIMHGIITGKQLAN
jgi:hypothetical protein